MSSRLVNANVVIAARQFNPSVMSQLWLIDNQIVERDEFEPGCIFTDMIVQANAAPFVLFVTPEQLQFTPRAAPEGQQGVIVERLGRIVQALPHTPYFAIGLNFTWHFTPERIDVGRISRDLFYLETSAVFREFGAEDARFGGYLSKNALGLRMKLDVKPMTNRTDDQVFEFMQFAFNFNLDVNREANAPDAILGALNRWHEADEESKRIMNCVEGGIE